MRQPLHNTRLVQRRNPNTGHPLGEDAISDLRTATQTVYHEQAYPSRVIVRILV